MKSKYKISFFKKNEDLIFMIDVALVLKPNESKNGFLVFNYLN